MRTRNPISPRDAEKATEAFYAEHAATDDAIVPQKTVINALYSGYLTVSDVLDKVSSAHPVFAHGDYEILWRKMLDAHESGMPISQASIPSGMADLSEGVPGFPPDALEAVAASQTRRIGIRLQVDAIAAFQKTSTKELPSKIASIAHGLLDLVETREASPVKTIGQAHDAAMIQLESAILAFREGRIAGLRVGVDALDQTIGGLKGGELSVVMTGTSVGKSILMGQTARIAGQSGRRVLVFSLEMTAVEYKQRWWSSLTGINLAKIRHGTVNNIEYDRIKNIRSSAENWPISIDDRSGCNIAQIVARAKNYAARVGKPDLIVVDYLQRISPMSGEDGERELARSSKELKNLAKDLNCHVMTASQINEKDIKHRSGKEKDQRPTRADVKGAMAIAEESDLLISGSRNMLGEDDTKAVRDFAILKNRNGPLSGYKPVIFWKNWMLFSEENPENERTSA